MHFLHKILVHIPSAIDVDEETPREEILRAVIEYAKDQTECFCESVFDWREDNSAGRWANTYPQHAYIASDNLEWFMKELNEAIAGQKEEIDDCLKQICDAAGSDLVQITDQLWNLQSNYYDPSENISGMTAYYLRALAQHLNGEYRCDSRIYNTKDYTSHIYPRDLDIIREKPSEWALVMFDYHY